MFHGDLFLLGCETLPPLKDILVTSNKCSLFVLHVFQSKTYSGINISFAFSIKYTLIIYLIIISLGNIALLIFVEI